MKQRSSPLFVLVAMITAVASLYVAKSILLPVSLAILISFLLTPLADRLERWRIPRVVAVVSLVAISFAVMGALGWVVTNQLVQVSTELQVPQRKDELINKLKRLQPHSPTIDKISKTLSDIRNAVTQGAGPTDGTGQNGKGSNDGSKATNPADETPPIKETVKVETNHPANSPKRR